MSTKSIDKLESFSSLDLGIDISELQSPSHIKPNSSLTSSSFLNSSFSQLGIPFPDLPNYDDDEEHKRDVYNPQQHVSPYGISHVSSWTSATSFDGELQKFFTDIAKESSENPEISLLILNTWNELSKSAPGHPGEVLAAKLNELPEDSISPTLLNQCFAQLDDIRTTISSPISACLFYQSCLVLYQKLPKGTILGECALDIFRESIITACTKIGDEIVDLYIKALQLSSDSEIFKKIVNRLLEIRKRFSTPSQEKLYNCIIEYLDCQIANTVIINHLAESVLSATKMNTDIAEIELVTKTKLVRFQELLLIVIANNQILENPKEYNTLTPHIEPNLAYLMLCNIHPDEIQPEKIDYKLIDNFMTVHNVNLNVNHEDLLLKIENIEITDWDNIEI
ncbi:hypothetical protein TVAG_020550 [Trichomonas vaginalis G3]|uniref:Uncharacterized protein n=1 Tax=Trichomonas vaginalis (strain ATCC PRA-98 / G3) TaxID=412133 RepID=A2EXW9_TRIV3|nr:hypothetical protein TVAGG3_0318010 [Trichomonas vaginalis G3]EAY02502.1 hypothetical protein TVAG_020550 [Trichomonas vaginalis G3]KAI5529078.1 hypothetical protein TVAGG3_0318010 [Trichomonas vaginalis G3]|eukprot:XP_001314741.1 hypothetical protein [Trichomonas vaginalis G3]